MNGKTCLKCNKKFLNGKKIKSKVIECSLYKGYVHESSKFCNVNITRGNTDYKCPSCDSVEVQNTHISGGVEFQLRKITKQLKETTDVQTIINC